MNKIRKDDVVLVTAGKDRGKRGKVRVAYPKQHRVTIEGVNLIKRHFKPRPGVRQAGIVEREAPIQASNVMLICNKCNRPARVGFKLLEDNKKVRVCKKCKEVLD